LCTRRVISARAVHSDLLNRIAVVTLALSFKRFFAKALLELR
jgi:hypothetical protein